MKDFLQGKWLKHPLHPILVSLPVGLWPMALVFDLLSMAGVGGNAMVRTSFYAIVVGLVGALLAIPTGLADWSDIKKDKPAWRIGLYHMGLNIAVAIIFAFNLGLRMGPSLEAESVAVLPTILSAAGTAILFVGVYLGGRMIYAYGIWVARVSKKKWRKIAEQSGTAVPDE